VWVVVDMSLNHAEQKIVANTKIGGAIGSSRTRRILDEPNLVKIR